MHEEDQPRGKWRVGKILDVDDSIVVRAKESCFQPQWWHQKMWEAISGRNSSL